MESGRKMEEEWEGEGKEWRGIEPAIGHHHFVRQVYSLSHRWVASVFEKKVFIYLLTIRTSYVIVNFYVIIKLLLHAIYRPRPMTA